MTHQRRDRFGRGGAYVCRLCRKRARDPRFPFAGVELCKRCYVTEGVRNGHNDNGHAGAFDTCRECLDTLKSYGL